ncbi:hypothetical protein DAI22_11g095601 [Oryza sativa Japonica Group]|nr:hypothetical protein DAI22_11g095601 [Oryza sativa Japonica Group]
MGPTFPQSYPHSFQKCFVSSVRYETNSGRSMAPTFPQSYPHSFSSPTSRSSVQLLHGVPCYTRGRGVIRRRRRRRHRRRRRGCRRGWPDFGAAGDSQHSARPLQPYLFPFPLLSLMSMEILKQETASSPDDDGLASAAPPMAAAVVVPSSSLPPATRWGLSRGPAQRQLDNGEMERGGRVAGVDEGGRGAEVVEGEG